MVFENVEILFVIVKIDSEKKMDNFMIIKAKSFTRKRTICCSSLLAASFFPVVLNE
jgi:hypothetical protein